MSVKSSTEEKPELGFADDDRRIRTIEAIAYRLHEDGMERSYAWSTAKQCLKYLLGHYETVEPYTAAAIKNGWDLEAIWEVDPFWEKQILRRALRVEPQKSESNK